MSVTPVHRAALLAAIFVAAAPFAAHPYRGSRVAAAPAARQPTLPQQPQAFVDTSVPPPAGPVRAVRAGGNLQAAVDAAKPGDVIELEAGATFTGPLELPAKPGEQYIHIRSSRHAELPADGRVGPEHAALMPTVVCPNASHAVATRSGAHHFWFTGIRFVPAKDAKVIYEMIKFGDGGQTSLDAVPHHLVVDRCLMPDTDKTVQRGIALQSAHTAVINSYISGCHGVGFDTQALCGWNGPGPFKIVNNYIAGAGENVMFGGADAQIPNLTPSDIEIRRNHFHKPNDWNWNHRDFKPLNGESVVWRGKQYEKASGGTPQHWTVKNLLELKHAKRVLIDGNLFENHWTDAQSGHAILFTVRNQDGKNPWAQVADVTATNNILRNAPAGINILGSDDLNPSQRTARILIRNWAFENMSWEAGNGVNSLFQILGGDDITIDRVSCAALKGNLGLVDGVVNRLQFTNNIVPNGAYGIHIDNGGSVETRLPERTFDGNVIIGGDGRSWPFGGRNAFPPTSRAVGFADEERGDLRLGDNSRYKGAGADLSAIQAAMGAGAAPAATRPRRVVSR